MMRQGASERQPQGKAELAAVRRSVECCQSYGANACVRMDAARLGLASPLLARGRPKQPEPSCPGTLTK